ncbi:HAMP domain-containing histidine kinase [Tateyamaria omphalii]|uniref:PAS domain-containing sensor histidine kinase n=1 Tax=Tateyamaria omphalii TaxID=299262 RepID=UPI001C99D086|nr:HAMP domain-containing sensor histidine kinase [Tateyamaria omphalii]MBY5932993.1 HAMP domain-containing histidine kinase [Tateyamaria omphalii]
MNMMPAARFVKNRYSQDVDRALNLLPADADVDADTLSAAFLASPYACFLLDQEGRVLVCNRRAERMYCPPTHEMPDGLRGMGLHKLTKLTHEETMETLRKGAARSSMELPMVTSHGANAVRPTMFRVALLRSSALGQRLYLLTQDHLKAAADALSQMNQRRISARKDLVEIEGRFVDLHASLIAMESFAHQASHDLRTPLSTISGMLQLFETRFGDDLPDKAHQYLDVMRRAAEQMDTLTCDFLEHARSVSAEVAAEPVDLQVVLEDVRRDLQNGMAPSEFDLRIACPSLTVMAEPTLLRMLLSNLLGNAIKYRHPDRRLRIDVALHTEPDGTHRLTIADTGSGFDPSESEAIFLPFRRLHMSIDGTGMGLSTCAEVCRRHGWSISASSDGESGATFTLLFPHLQPSV